MRRRFGFYAFAQDENVPIWRYGQWMWHPTIRGKYLGVLAKGWWRLAPGWRRRDFRHFEVEFAVGGEDNVAGFTLWLPFLIYVAFGVRLPRRFTSPWVYERRKWSFAFVPWRPGFDLSFAYDSTAGEMRDYYLGDPKPHSTCGNCGGLKWAHELDEAEREKGGIHAERVANCPGFARGYTPSRLALWKGWELRIPLPRLRDLIFGKPVYASRDIQEAFAVVPMPEGNYPFRFRFHEDSWKRPRAWWTSKKLLRYSADPCDADGNPSRRAHIPFPGKGENSWDCGDDGLYGQTASIPRLSLALAVSNVAESVMRAREKHASRWGWQGYVPDDGWPDCLRPHGFTMERS